MNFEKDDITKNTKIPFKETKDDIWTKISDQIEDKVPKSGKVVKMSIWKLSIAASFIILVSLGLFARFYTITVTTTNELASVTLPDNSEVTLNTNSQLAYHPYWWGVERTMNFEGEGFFEVQKGSNFSVVSEGGTTEVLGTSFNINTEETYTVYCETGKVRVSSGKQKVIITPNQVAQLQNEKLTNQEVPNERQFIAWKMSRFEYENTPLINVFEDLNYRFGITINCNDKLAYLPYSGSFQLDKEPKQILDIITKVFNLKVNKLSPTEFEITED